MRLLKLSFVFLLCVTMASCVTSKKYKALDADFKKMETQNNDCNSRLSGCQSDKYKLAAQNAQLQARINELNRDLADQKNNTSQVLTTLQDMSVLSGKQAESVRESLKTIGQKDNVINSLQSAMARKDSLNMALVMNLKGALGDINDKDVTITVEKSAIFIDISDKMLFNSGRYTVTPRAREVLGKVAAVLNAHPNIEFMVEGHTDNVPIHTECLDDNWDLSVKRATSVVRILQKEYGITPSRMTAAGHSEYIPIESNATADGRSLNRRTRIVILPQLDQFFKLLIRK